MFNTDTNGKYAVIFSAQRTTVSEGYAEALELLRGKLPTIEGYIGMESAENSAGYEITVSYWEDQSAILRWASDTDHLNIRSANKNKWYENFKVRVVKIEREYGMGATREGHA